MILKTNNGDVEIKTNELDFANMVCDLEDNGVDIMMLLDDEGIKHMKLFSTMRAILAVLIGTTDLKAAGKVLSEHLKNGGEINDIMDVFTEAMESAGFGKSAKEEAQEQTAEVQEQPTVETTIQTTESTSVNTTPLLN